MTGKRRMLSEPPPPPPPILPPPPPPVAVVAHVSNNDTILIENYLEQQPRRSTMPSMTRIPINQSQQATNEYHSLNNDIVPSSHKNKVVIGKVSVDSRVVANDAEMREQRREISGSLRVNVEQATTMGNTPTGAYMVDTEDSRKSSLQSDEEGLMMRPIDTDSQLQHYCTLRTVKRTSSSEEIPAFCTLHRRKHRNRSIRKRKSTNHSIPDTQVNDYLQELDAYLDEIDQESITYSSTSSDEEASGDLEGIQQMFGDCATSSSSSLQHHHQPTPASVVSNESDTPNIDLQQNRGTNGDAVTSHHHVEVEENNHHGPLFLKQLNNYCTLRIPSNGKKNKQQNVSTPTMATASSYFPTSNDIHDYFVEIKAKNCGGNRNRNGMDNCSETVNKSEIENQSNLCNNGSCNELLHGGCSSGNKKSDCFKRDKTIRHTIIGGQTKKRESSDGSGSSCDGATANVAIGPVEQAEPESSEVAEPLPKRGRQLSWLRNSMRKTRPIDIPATNLPPAHSQPSTSRDTRHNMEKLQHTRSNPRPRQRAPDVPVPAPPLSDFNNYNQVSYSPLPPVIDSNSLPHSHQHRNSHQQQLPRSRSHSGNHRHSSPAGSHPEVPIRINMGIELNDTSIFNTILNTTTASTTTTASPTSPASTNASTPDRPRQMGRRSEARPRVVSINVTTPERERDRPPASTRAGNHRPNSAPARVSIPARNNSSSSVGGQRNQSFLSSEPSSAGSSRNPSPVSIVSSTASSSMASGVENTTQRSRQRPRITDLDDNTDEAENNASKTTWPHIISRILASTSCTLGLFNLSRFAIFSIHFGANFIVQFLILTFLFGCPFLWLQMCLAAKIKGGPVQMWRISPICKGVGIALLIAQGVLTIYSSISVGWVLVYFRDSFVTHSNHYRWQEFFELYRGPYINNQSARLSDTVADYFNGVVLQRLQLGPAGRAGGANMGAVRFQLAFNLGIIWTFVFIVLCRGIRSYGKFVIVLGILPYLGLIVVCSKFLSMINFDSVQNIFPATDWQDFFLNSRSWVSAAQETFLTWALLGVSVYSMYSKSYHTRPTKTELRRDALIIVLLTIFGLLLGAILGSSCVQILNQRNFFYYPGSYENIKTYVFLLPADKPLPHYLQSIPAKWIDRYSMVLGENQKLFGANTSKESGYQVLRLITELFPAALAAATQDYIAPIWSLLGYLTFLLLGMAQLCAMWKPLAGSLGNSPSSVLLSCITGLFLGIPLATESGIQIIHYLDTVLGGAWWVLVLWFAHFIGVFLIRGSPYTSDVLVNDLQMPQSFSAFIAFSWNVLLPIGMLLLSVIQYRVSNSREFFQWRPNNGYYWPQWTRQIAGGLQIGFLLIVPFIVLVQMYRYLSKGPPDILDRIQLLYRPVLNNETAQRHPPLRRLQHPLPERTNPTIISLDQQLEDAPPKYTPPPSYTTATGARIAKMLRQSIRRSVRRIMGEGSRQHQTTSVPPIDIPPPNYSTIILSETSTRDRPSISIIPTSGPGEVAVHGPRILFNSETLGRRRSLSTDISNASTLTPRDVAQFLRPSNHQQQPHPPSSNNATNSLSLVRNTLRSSLTRRHSRSVENLVMAAAPLGDSSIINLADHRNYEENVSVI